MHFATLLPFVALLASAVSASAPTSPFTSLTRRQTTTDCTAACQNGTSQISVCNADFKCICSDAIVNALLSCTRCAYEVTPSSLPALQSTMDQYADACRQGGVDIGNPQVANGIVATPSTSSAPVLSPSTAISTPGVVTSTSPPLASTQATRSASAPANTAASATTSANPLSGSGGMLSSGSALSGSMAAVLAAGGAAVLFALA